MLYYFLDNFFIIFHTFFILFNLLGWIWKKARKVHFFCIVFTGISWFGLGWFYGWGYCPFTDWHWQVKRKLGTTDLPNSFIKYLLDCITGWNWDAILVDNITAGGFLMALVLSIVLQLKSITGKKEYDNDQ